MKRAAFVVSFFTIGILVSVLLGVISTHPSEAAAEGGGKKFKCAPMPGNDNGAVKMDNCPVIFEFEPNEGYTYIEDCQMQGEGDCEDEHPSGICNDSECASRDDWCVTALHTELQECYYNGSKYVPRCQCWCYHNK